jgi:predicted nucleic acid-binding protein
MANQYLLDTNTVSYIILGNIPAVRRRLVRVPMALVFISAVTEGELRFGVARRPGVTKLEQIVEEFLLRVTILPWDSGAVSDQELKEVARLATELNSQVTLWLQKSRPELLKG